MRRFALLLLLVLPAACGDPEPPPWLEDTGVPFVDYGLAWTDDRTLLFQTMEQTDPTPDPTDPWSAFVFPLTRWTRDGSRETLTRADLSRFCWSPESGTLSYLVQPRDGSAPTFHFGAPGRMRAGAAEAPARDVLFNPFTCAFEARPAGLEGHALLALRPGHGLIDLGRPGTPGPAQWRRETGDALPLPFTRTEVAAASLSRAGDGYRLHARANRDAPCRTVWRLDPETGTAAEEACVAEQASERIVRTALGWALDRRHFDADGDVNDSGIYLIAEDGREIRLAHGFTENLAVSPDGCRIAFGHAPDLETSCTDGTYVRKTLKVVDLCRHRGAILGR